MLFSILLLAASAAAGPLSRRANGATKAFHSRNTLVGMDIHDSCNATEVRQLRKAFAETYELVTTARDCEYFSLLRYARFLTGVGRHS